MKLPANRRHAGRSALIGARGLLASLALGLCGSPLPAQGATQTAALPAAMRQAGTLFARDVAGWVGHLEEADTRIKAPLVDRTAQTRTWVISRDGDPQRAIVLSYRREGRNDEGERAKLEKQVNEGYRSRERQLQAPFDLRHMDDYEFQEASCPGSEAGERCVGFRSRLRDARHGDGTLLLNREGRVRLVSYAPSQLPAQAGQGSVRIVRGPAGPGWWGRQRLEIRFEGGLGPLAGSFQLSQRVSAHRRFGSLGEAIAGAPAGP
ncbi:MAG: hypothetical protein VKP62_03200 [Candidatus Sericytochromatia bacterium]|nr:hypothetical protein [Candidatus Sericytochromatia bacterium]